MSQAHVRHATVVLTLLTLAGGPTVAAPATVVQQLPALSAAPSTAQPTAPLPPANNGGAPRLLTLPPLPGPASRPDTSITPASAACAVSLPGGLRMLDMPATGTVDANLSAGARASTTEVPDCRAARKRDDDRTAATPPAGTRVESRVVNGRRVQQLRLGDDDTAGATNTPPAGPAPEVRQLPDGRQMLVLPEADAPR